MNRWSRLRIALVALLACPLSTIAQDRQGDSPARSATAPAAGMKLALIRAGAFEMGSNPSEAGRTRSELQHTTRITRPFYLSATEVTQEEFESVMDKNPSAFSKIGASAASVNNVATGRFPVENVTWFDAIEFCNLLSKKEKLKEYYELDAIDRDGDVIRSATVNVIGGPGYRLPTEAEWEYACRAGTTTSYVTGEPIALLGQAAWYGGTADIAGNSQERSHRVGLKIPNDFGLFDMHGNVSEWCHDWYDYSAYERAARNDPAGPSGGSEKVIRGGSWNTEPVICRSASRGAMEPGKRSSDIGFRVARTVIPATPKVTSVPPYRVVVDLRDSGTIDLYLNESYDTIDAARERLGGSKLFGNIGNIRIIDANGKTID